MWVSRDKLESMERRIADLERAAKNKDDVEFTVYEESALKAAGSSVFMYPWYCLPQQTVTVKHAIKKILTHLGLQLTYRKGTPASVSLTSTAAKE